MQSSIRAEPMVSTKQTSRPRSAERFIASRARWLDHAMAIEHRISSLTKS
jgi:hypothetical protein